MATQIPPSSNDKRCQLAICRVFFVASAGSLREPKLLGSGGSMVAKLKLGEGAHPMASAAGGRRAQPRFSKYPNFRPNLKMLLAQIA